MKIQTLAIVVGTSGCDAKCPFCVSKTTPSASLPTEVNWRNFKKACRLAQIGGATTAFLTGKGEPTLYPKLITGYLKNLEPFNFPFIELQTNGMRIGNGELDEIEPFWFLDEWYKLGLTTVCLSAVHYEQEANFAIYSPKYPRIEDTVKKLHKIGYTVRLSIMMMTDGIDRPEKIENLIKFCKKNKIKQLTIRPITYPEKSETKVAKWTKEHTVEAWALDVITNWMNKKASPVLTLAHGATVYDYDGQNVCLANCLTTNETTDDMRQIIFYPSGTISHDWKFSGSVLL